MSGPNTFRPHPLGDTPMRRSVQKGSESPATVLRISSVKSVKFGCTQTSQTRELLESFRAMVNHAIHTCLEENIKGRLKLRDRIYKEFQREYEVLSVYPYAVAEVAWSIVKKHGIGKSG